MHTPQCQVWTHIVSMLALETLSRPNPVDNTLRMQHCSRLARPSWNSPWQWSTIATIHSNAHVLGHKIVLLWRVYARACASMPKLPPLCPSGSRGSGTRASVCVCVQICVFISLFRYAYRPLQSLMYALTTECGASSGIVSILELETLSGYNFLLNVLFILFTRTHGTLNCTFIELWDGIQSRTKAPCQANPNIEIVPESSIVRKCKYQKIMRSCLAY